MNNSLNTVFRFVICSIFVGSSVMGQPLSERITSNLTYSTIEQNAYSLLEGRLNAGSVYPEIWIRDLNTFILPKLEITPASEIRGILLNFFLIQGSDGNIPDNYIPITNPLQTSKNTVETDQETSLIQAVYKYIKRTGDRSILSEVVAGISVKSRMENALNFLLNQRYSAAHGLIWGATTADWGDVQPEDDPGVLLNMNSHKAIDIYDNAMFVIAIDNFLALESENLNFQQTWRPVVSQLRKNVRAILWDEVRQKFRPHVYLEGSPFPSSFNEDEIYYHGGTTVAIEAGLLTPQESIAAFQKMIQNKLAAGANSVGLTMYPTYPAGYFANSILSSPYTYQNGGDWTWFGARTIGQMVFFGELEQAYNELQPMIDRVINQGNNFAEWNSLTGTSQGSATYLGTAGVLINAITAMREAVAPNASRLISPVTITASTTLNSSTNIIVGPISAVATDTYDVFTSTPNTLNATGISDNFTIQSGQAYPSIFPYHTNGQETHWHSANNTLQPTITWDLSQVHSVVGFHLWNHNQNPDGTNNLTNRGLRDISIFTSNDNITYTFGGSLINLVQAPGSNTYRGEDYSITLSSARYIRFQVIRNWGSQQVTGLSEIRFRATGQAQPAVSSVTTEALRNSKGLERFCVTAEAVPSIYPKHGNINADEMWLSPANATTSVTFHLGQAFDLSGFHLWNYNRSQDGLHLTNGVTNALVAVSQDGVNFGAPIPMTFSLARGSGDYRGTNYPLVSAGVVAVRFSNLSNSSSPDGSVGLSEIRFIGKTWSKFQNWKFSYFGNLDVDLYADKDQDTLGNLLEYALGSDPRVSNPTALPKLEKIGQDYFFTFQRIADPSLNYQIRSSTTLQNDWQSVWNSTTTLSAYDTVRFNAQVGVKPKQFFQLHVTQ